MKIVIAKAGTLKCCTGLSEEEKNPPALPWSLKQSSLFFCHL